MLLLGFSDSGAMRSTKFDLPSVAGQEIQRFVQGFENTVLLFQRADSWTGITSRKSLCQLIGRSLLRPVRKFDSRRDKQGVVDDRFPRGDAI